MTTLPSRHHPQVSRSGGVRADRYTWPPLTKGGGVPLTGPMKTATFLIRLTPEERDRLNAMAREQRISLAQAMREGAKLYLQELRSDTAERAPGGVRVAT